MSGSEPDAAATPAAAVLVDERIDAPAADAEVEVPAVEAEMDVRVVEVDAEVAEAESEVAEPDVVETESPAAEEPAVAEPAVAEPVVEEPAAEPVDTEPEPVVEEPLVEDPVIETEPETPAPSAAPPTTVARRPVRQPVVRPKQRAAVQPIAATDIALSVRNLTKSFDGVKAVDSVDFDVRTGTFFGFVGPNGAGKTTTLAMITGLLRPDSGVVRVHGADVWRNASIAKRSLGVLPDNLRLFDRLTGREYLHHAGALRRLDRDTIAVRIDDLANAFGLRRSLDRFVSDYSAGMVKKIGIAAAMIHSPRLLVLDEPFESVDPVSAATIIGILKRYAAAGGTVVLSSHSMGLIERTCDAVGIIAEGRMLAAGPMQDLLQGQSLEARFVELAGGATAVEGMEWLLSYSD